MAGSIDDLTAALLSSAAHNYYRSSLGVEAAQPTRREGVPAPIAEKGLYEHNIMQQYKFEPRPPSGQERRANRCRYQGLS